MAISKKERARLLSILASLDQGIAFIDRPSTFLAVKTYPGAGMAFKRTVTAGQVEHVLRRDDPLAFEGEQAISTIAKDIGSEFTLARNTRRELARFLCLEGESI